MNLHAILPFLRNTLYSLDIDSNKIHHKRYQFLRFQFIKENEGCKKITYRDTKNLRTIGIGFNLDASTAHQEWTSVFEKKISYYDVLSGKRHLTLKEIRMLFQKNSEIRLHELKKIYGRRTWMQLRANERLAIEDAYFNGPRLVNRSTRFFQNVQCYVAHKDTNFLKKAVIELRHHSNNGSAISFRHAVQKRRDAQACLLESYKCH